MFRIDFYVPESHLDQVKMALFEKGAGKIGNYDCCCWQTRGEGQFRPLEGSQPFSGEKDKIEIVDGEYKVEMVCEDDAIGSIINTLKEVHPYDEPAYSFWSVNTKT